MHWAQPQPVFERNLAEAVDCKSEEVFFWPFNAQHVLAGF